MLTTEYVYMQQVTARRSNHWHHHQHVGLTLESEDEPEDEEADHIVLATYSGHDALARRATFPGVPDVDKIRSELDVTSVVVLGVSYHSVVIPVGKAKKRVKPCQQR